MIPRNVGPYTSLRLIDCASGIASDSIRMRSVQAKTESIPHVDGTCIRESGPTSGYTVSLNQRSTLRVRNDVRSDQFVMVTRFY